MLAALEPAPLNRAQGCDHQHVVGFGALRITGAAQQIAAIWRAERPGIFELGEAEEWAQPRVLIAYLLGLIGTVGSGIWPSRWISWIHCCGLRICETWVDSALFEPNIGV